ncbi:MAG: alpha/beta fold hydrolase [Bacteroidales bacterium]|nr:alpha/beta fold hydrolase [Candidatus Hennigimonas equi]
MNSRFFTLAASSDDINLSVAAFEPDRIEEAKGIFQIVHGMVEHKERYYDFIEWLVDKGYICVIHDHRGHGASVNGNIELGYMGEGGWKAMVEDVKIAGDWARKTYGPLEFTLFGHSMGSMVVRSYLKRYDDTIDRLFVCGTPANNAAKGVGKVLAWTLGTFGGWHSRPQLLQDISFKNYNRGFEKEAEKYSKAWSCSDPKVQEEMHNDPLCTFRFTANGFYNLYSVMADCYSPKGWKLSNTGIRIHFISGNQDPCRKSDGDFHKAVEFLRSRGYDNVSAKLYPGLRHQLINEKGREGIWNDILGVMSE